MRIQTARKMSELSVCVCVYHMYEGALCDTVFQSIWIAFSCKGFTSLSE